MRGVVCCEVGVVFTSWYKHDEILYNTTEIKSFGLHVKEVTIGRICY